MKKVLILAMMLLTCSTLLAQNRVTGKVVSSEDGEPVPFASIVVKGTMKGIASNADGYYVLDGVPKDAVLVFSSVGFKDLEIPVGGKNVINATLQPDANMLEETVVVAYGSAKKISSVVGAATLVKSDAFTKIPAASAGDALQGKVAGLQVYTSSGEPSATVSMRLRGVNSINASNTPLFILDGTPVDVAIFTALNPNDIENVTVMKDASSTAIYGSRAANGVVYITTKKGAGEKPTVTVSGSYGISNLAQFPMELMNAQEWFDFRELADPSLKTNAQFQALKKFRLDNNTYELADEIDKAYYAQTSHHPYLVMAKIMRNHVDFNRKREWAIPRGDDNLGKVYDAYHNYVAQARTEVTSLYGSGLLLDIHGQSHSQHIELGYLLTPSVLDKSDATLDSGNYAATSSIPHLAQTNKSGFSFSQVLRGTFSFGGYLHANGLECVPRPGYTSPGNNPYFYGGYTTRIYGSYNGGTIDAIQCEFRYSYRDTQSERLRAAAAFAKSISEFMAKHR